MPPAPAPPITDDEARRLYLETAVPVRAIAGRLGVSERAFRRLRDRLGWPRRVEPAPRAGRVPSRLGLVVRLRRQIGRRLVELERAEAAASAAEYAALLRAVTELARLEGQVKEAQAAPRAASPSAREGSDGQPDASINPDRLREAIARRVETFGGGRPAAGLPGDASPA